MIGAGFWPNALPGILVALFGGGGIYALLKLRPEAGQISVTAAQGAVIVQSQVLESLREEVDRLTRRIEDVDALRSRIEALESEKAGLERENTHLRDRVSALEAEVENLRRGQGGST